MMTQKPGKKALRRDARIAHVDIGVHVREMVTE